MRPPCRRSDGGGPIVSMRAYFPSTAFLKSSPGPGFGPIHVARIASAVGLPGSVPFALPLTSTVVPCPGTYVRRRRLPFGIGSIQLQSVLKFAFTSAEGFFVLSSSPSSHASHIWLLLTL